MNLCITPTFLISICPSDIDECAKAVPPCQQKCENTKGGYACSCEDGFMINPLNADECLGKNFFSLLFFSLLKWINSYSGWTMS